MAFLFKNISSRELAKNQYTYGIIKGELLNEAFLETKYIVLLAEN